MSLVIRDATLEDIDFIAELELLLFPGYQANEHGVKLVIEAGMVQVSDRAGYIVTAWGPELIDVLRVGVHPDRQGRGIGRELMQSILDVAWLPIVLTVKRENTRARVLYRKLGFEFVGVVPQEEALVMLRSKNH